MGGNTDRFQYRGSGDLGPGPGTSGGPQPQIERGTLFKERVARVIESATQKIHGAGGSWPRGLAGK